MGWGNNVHVIACYTDACGATLATSSSNISDAVAATLGWGGVGWGGVGQ